METSSPQFSFKAFLGRFWRPGVTDRDPRFVWRIIVIGAGVCFFAELGMVYIINQGASQTIESTSPTHQKQLLNEKSIQNAVAVYTAKEQRYQELSAQRPFLKSPGVALPAAQAPVIATTTEAVSVPIAVDPAPATTTPAPALRVQ